ncbi:argininosuccinate lyase [Streptomyces sp. NPDC059566]|uniref:argininosuccinate lyase n=1 Tax=Streptomyces sp. NPDC059566 TaxID=3346866 RepID=UPI00367FDCAD
MTSDTTRSGVDTGRLGTALHPEAHAIVYDQYLPAGDSEDAVGEELRLISEVDRAHLVMLVECGIVDAPRAAALLDAIDGLRRDGFAPVRSRPMPRGVYLAYESWLSERLGDDVGGVLHTGRSRNDLNATTARLRGRDVYRRLLESVEGLAAVLLAKAEEHGEVTMPAYTHGQPAVPITYGHYLAGLGCAVLRAFADLLHAGMELDTNPLGAGAVGGTSVAIDTGRTSELLGFTAPAANSVDAVASRDFGLRLLSASGVLGVAVSRAARDLAAWTTEEVALLRLADDLVGSSSMMPQKRNPFLLEHIQGRATASLGAFSAAASAMATAPYTNSIAVTNEALRQVWPGLRNTTDAVTLLRLVLAGAEPDAGLMLRRAVDGHTSATYLAEQLVSSGMPFRSSHHLVGRVVLRALNASRPLADAVRDTPEIARVAPHDDIEHWLDPATVARANAYGGGPGPASRAGALAGMTAEFHGLRAEFTARRDHWAHGAVLLDAAVGRVTSR